MKGQVLAAEHDISLVQAVERADQPQSAAHRLVQETFQHRERTRACCPGNGLDPRQPRARVSMLRSRHQTAALTVSRRLRPGR